MIPHTIVFDTETTGLSRLGKQGVFQNRSITENYAEVNQIGGIILDANMKPIKLFCYYCDCLQAETSQGALKVSGISMRIVREHIRYQYLSNILHTYLPEFFSPDVLFVGYNIDFDIDLVQQSIRNSREQFDASPLHGSVVPNKGRHRADVMKIIASMSSKDSAAGGVVRTNTWRKLASFDKELEYKREAFIHQYSQTMGVETNCPELLVPTMYKKHNSFYDALNTYLLWEERVWKKKLH